MCVSSHGVTRCDGAYVRKPNEKTKMWRSPYQSWRPLHKFIRRLPHHGLTCIWWPPHNDQSYLMFWRMGLPVGCSIFILYFIKILKELVFNFGILCLHTTTMFSYRYWYSLCLQQLRLEFLFHWTQAKTNLSKKINIEKLNYPHPVQHNQSTISRVRCWVRKYFLG